MSSRSTVSPARASLVALVASALLPLAGCVSPADRFDEFTDRVVDAGGSAVECPLEPGDIGGEYLLGISVNISPDNPLQFRCSLEIVAGLLDMSCIPLTVDGRTDVGDPLGEQGIVLGGASNFVAHIAGTVPGSANPISGSDIETSEAGLELEGVVCGDGICGLLAGEILQPPVGAVTGTFAAVPVPDGATGDALPEPPSVACPLAAGT